jgi:hypothetical protein
MMARSAYSICSDRCEDGGPLHGENMRGKIVGGIFLTALLLGLALVPQRAASRQAPNVPEEPVPAFHTAPPQGPLPTTLSPAEFTNVVVQNAYTLAARVRKILYQQPCYCHCDRSQGHGSLLDCFASKHASVCDVCIREGLYSYEQSRKGKTAVQIRTGIEHGDWQQVDVTKYQAPLSAN